MMKCGQQSHFQSFHQTIVTKSLPGIKSLQILQFTNSFWKTSKSVIMYLYQHKTPTVKNLAQIKRNKKLKLYKVLHAECLK